MNFLFYFLWAFFFNFFLNLIPPLLVGFDFHFVVLLFIYLFICILFSCYVVSLKEREKKDINLCGWRSEAGLRGTGGGRDIIKIYCMKKLFNKSFWGECDCF